MALQVEDALEQVKGILEDVGIAEEMSGDMRLFDDLAMDSTELAQVSASLAKKFGLAISGKELKHYSIDQIVAAITA